MSFPGGILVFSPAAGLCLAAGALSRPAAAVGLLIVASITLTCLLAGQWTLRRLKEGHDDAPHHP